MEQRRAGVEQPGDAYRAEVHGKARRLADRLLAQGLEEALDVDGIDFWALGKVLRREVEAPAQEQASIGNLLSGDGQGGGRGCEMLTRDQVQCAMWRKVFRRLIAIIVGRQDEDFEVLIVTLRVGVVGEQLRKLLTSAARLN